MGVGIRWHVGNLNPSPFLQSDVKGEAVAVELMVSRVGDILSCLDPLLVHLDVGLHSSAVQRVVLGEAVDAQPHPH